MPDPQGRPAWAEVDLDAIAHNVAALVAHCGPTPVAAVVKAGGYGHGAERVARAALGAGAQWLGVALVDEGVALRESGIPAPILVLAEPRPGEMAKVVASGLVATLYTERGVQALAAAASTAGTVMGVHVKVNTGMNRVGAARGDIAGIVAAIDAAPSLALEGIWTHCAVADEPDNPFTAQQLRAFDEVVGGLAAGGAGPLMRHAANSAAAIRLPEARLDLVRIGIALYGISPAPELDDLAAAVGLRPALSLRARVTYVKRVRAGEGVSYGLRYQFDRDANVATVPLGYADGVPRRLPDCGGEVLIGGRRLPMAGVVTMDQFMVDCGDAPVTVDDEVVLIGAQGDEVITANEWGGLLGTIGYEVVCGIGPRVPREYIGD